MAPPLRVTLTTEEELTLQELRRASSVPYRVRDRAHMVLLNASGWNAPVIAEIMSCHEHTARAAIKRWEENGLYGLWEEEGRGKKRTWEPSDMDYIEQWLTGEERTYNSTQLAAKLKAERGVTLSPDWIRQLLKKRAIAGNAPAKAIGNAKTPKPEPSLRPT
ncbi:MAG: helix-turn-helix domain-containing protein [Cyanobacteria bacterium J06621_11]